jgi:hypothetical protein
MSKKLLLRIDSKHCFLCVQGIGLDFCAENADTFRLEKNHVGTFSHGVMCRKFSETTIFDRFCGHILQIFAFHSSPHSLQDAFLFLSATFSALTAGQQKKQSAVMINQLTPGSQ